tara:strand:+ start:83 stop:931 length:849 start_codon:yes stop_codon:yes gene_type:complete
MKGKFMEHKHKNLNDLSFFESDQIYVRSDHMMDNVKYFGQDVIVNNARVGTFSNMYTVNRTDEILSSVNAMISKAGIDVTDATVTDRKWNHGGRNSRTITFHSEKISPVKNVGDVSAMQITILNSYDGSMKASILFGLLRLICLNGMVSLSKLSSFSKKHSNTDALSSEYGKIASFKPSLEVYQNKLDTMSNKVISLEDAKKLLKDTIAKNEVKEKTLLEYVQNNTRESAGKVSLYDVYNGVTEWATHHDARSTADMRNVYLNRQMDVTKLLGSEQFQALAA